METIRYLPLDDRNLYYISSQDVSSVSKLRTPSSCVYALLEFVIIRDENEIIIKSIHTSPTHRNKGFAKRLLRCLQNNMAAWKVNTLTVDDMSANYRSIRNIYLKCGFQYDEDDGPEMSFAR